MKQKGQVALPVLISMAVTFGGVFAWTYSTFSKVNETVNTETTNRIESDANLQNELTTVDGKLTSINEKLDAIIYGLGIKYQLPKK